MESGKWKKVLMSFCGDALSIKRTILLFWSGYRQRSGGQERFASRVLLKELLGEEVRVDYHSTGAPCPRVRTFIY